MRKVRVNICLPPDQWQRIKERARQSKLSAGEYVSVAVDQAMAAEEAQRRSRLAAWEAVKDLDLGPMPDPDRLCEELSEAFAPSLGAEA